MTANVEHEKTARRLFEVTHEYVRGHTGHEDCQPVSIQNLDPRLTECTDADDDDCDGYHGQETCPEMKPPERDEHERDHREAGCKCYQGDRPSLLRYSVKYASNREC